MPVTEVKDYILRELDRLKFRLNKEAVYVDDKDIKGTYKALVGFKFDHIALQCYDRLEEMSLPFRFRKSLSRAFEAYMDKYGGIVNKIAYPADPALYPNQKIKGKPGFEEGPQRFEQSEEKRVSQSPRRHEYRSYRERVSSHR